MAEPNDEEKEVDRARRYSRVDHIGIQAHYIVEKLRGVLDDIAGVDHLLDQEEKRR